MENKIENLLRTVKSKIESHNEFKKAYDKQLAFDFNMLNFFKVNENKTSEIVAYFLNPKQKHGQGDAFLKIFLKHYENDTIKLKDISELERIKCEYSTPEKRRIDIYIKFKGGTVIAIENKIWASDQYHQLQDYAKFLEEEANKVFLLIYLSPYGHKPSQESINKEYRDEMTDNKNLIISSYKEDFIEIIKKWIAVSEADNVTYFLKQFKRYLEVKFLGNHNLNLNKMMEKIIKDNKEEVKAIIDAYNGMRDANEKKFDEIVKKLRAVANETKSISTVKDIELNLIGPFYQPEGASGKNAKYKAIKFKISNGDNILYLHLKCDFINLVLSHYFQQGTEESLIEEFKSEKKLFYPKEDVTDYNKEEIVRILKEKVVYAIDKFNKSLNEY